MAASFLGLFVQFWRLNLPRPEDWTWLARIGDRPAADAVLAGHGSLEGPVTVTVVSAPG